MKTDKQHRDDLTRLIMRAGRGDMEAFGQLHAALVPVVRNYLISLDGSIDYHRREELAQEVFLRTWQAASRFEGRSSAKTFVLAIAKNVFWKELSRRQKLHIIHMKSMDYFTDPSIPDESKNSRFDPEELSQAVRQATAKLPPQQRQAVELVQTSNLSRTEIAKQAGCTPSQFAARLCRAKKHLRQLLKTAENS